MRPAGEDPLTLRGVDPENLLAVRPVTGLLARGIVMQVVMRDDGGFVENGVERILILVRTDAGSGPR